MRKLKRGVERNRAKRVASRAAMTVMAATLVVGDSSIAVCAAHPSEYISELDTEDEKTSGEELIQKNSTQEATDAEKGTQEATDAEKGTQEATDAEKGTQEATDAERETQEATGSELKDESEATDIEAAEEKALAEGLTEETTEEENSARTRVLKSMRMLGNAPTKTTKNVTPNPGDKINIGNLEIDATTGKIEISIEQDGEYTLTGSNCINGAYVDVQIVVADRVKADLNFDGLSIVNNVGYDTSGFTTCAMETPSDVVSPIVAKGTANIHVISNSEIAALTDFFSVDGELNFVDSKDSAILTFLYTSIPTFSYEGNSGAAISAEVVDCDGSGKVCFKDALVKIKNQTRNDGSGYGTLRYVNDGNGASDKIYLEGTGISCEGINFTNCSVYTSLTNMDGMSFPNAKILGLTGGELHTANITRLPANGKIIQVDVADSRDNMSVTYTMHDDLNVDSEGNLKGVLTGRFLYLYVESNGVVKGYNAWSGDTEPNTAQEMATYCITYVDAYDPSTVLDKFYSVVDNCIFVPKEDDRFLYTYSLENGTELEKERRVDMETGFSCNDVIKDKRVSENTTILVKKVEKAMVALTVDGTPQQVDYGKTLAELGYSGYYMNTATGKLVSLDEKITEALSVKKLNLTTQTKGSTEYFCLSSPEDLKCFAKLVNSGNTSINGLLTSDITPGSDFDMIGSFEYDGNYFGTVSSENGYAGVFDGQGHTVTLNIDKSSESYVGLFRCITAGASVKNIVLKGSVRGGDCVGALTGAVFCKDGGAVNIENCINYAAVMASQEDGSCGGFVGVRSATINSNNSMQLLMNHCGNNGTVSGTKAYGIIADNKGMANITIKNSYCSTDNGISGASATIENCYSAGDSEYNGTKVLSEAFTSGEVTYLLNRGEGTEKWFQTCGNGEQPAFSGQSVYAGYEDCIAEELSYANTAFTHTVQGHKDNESYSYADGSIVAGCSYCGEAITAKVNIANERLGKNMNGVTVTYSDAWTKAKYPDVTIKYCKEIDGTYTEEQPSTAGTWYVKAYVGSTEQEVDINDMYVVKPKKQPENKESKKENSESNITIADENDSTPVMQENQRIDDTISQIKSLDRIAKSADSTSRSNMTEYVVEYSGGAIPKSIIDALKNSSGVVLHYTCTYMGKKYDFTITGDEDFFFDENVQWYGPLYIQHLINLRNIRIARLNGRYNATRNDTVYSIAKKFGITVKRLLELNPNIRRNGRLLPGQRIRL